MSNDNLHNENLQSNLIIQVYNHYHALALNQHNIINERMTQFFLGNTFLLSGFIASSGISRENTFFHSISKVRYWLPKVAILLSAIYAVFFIIPSIKTLKQWGHRLEEIEKKYIKQNTSSVLFSLVLPYEAKQTFKKWDTCPLYVGFPLLIVCFVFLWIIAMI